MFSLPDLLNQLSNCNSPNPRPMTTKALTLTIKFSWGQETLLLVKMPGTQGAPARLTEMSTVLGWTFQRHSSFESPCSCNPHQLIKLPSDTTVSWACPLFPFWGEQLFFSHILRQSQNSSAKKEVRLPCIVIPHHQQLAQCLAQRLFNKMSVNGYVS